MIANQEIGYWLHPNNNNDENSVFSLTQHIVGVNMSPYSSVETQGTNSDYYERLLDQSQIQEPLDAYSRFTVGQKFTITAFSPEYCYASEATSDHYWIFSLPSHGFYLGLYVW
jgi:hypothetical protein